jgi:hypothetical protein
VLFRSADVNNRVVGVELAVGALERLRDARDRLDHVQALKQLRVDRARIPDEAEDRAELPNGDVHVEPSALEPFCQVVDLLLRRAGL